MAKSIEGKSGFTHHKESLCHHTPSYKGSESAPPFGLIYKRERKREVVMLLRYLERHAEEHGATKPDAMKAFYVTVHCSPLVNHTIGPGKRE